ncbi:DUF72 domain-containing protein [Fulvivirga sediminis]|uniref:DUF72 domain-containing protein n=1 Tax=Fulvivirga sediminis TaxID=2803949 RepID=A0A937F6R7_9BACT|nr:DUF72 domain-containing protein [Fulvivirga sediminis]MBL3655664.1 DUF72 domain-containing protein [Fulvivirga sediminis]
MKFGKPSSKEELDNIDLSLPADHPDTSRNLSKGKQPVKVYIGCAKWGRKEWVGLIYPEGTKERDFLQQYVKNFNSIELNTTFYSIKKENVESWTSQAPDGFKFCPKFSRTISHLKRLNDDSKRFTDYFLEAAYSFGDKLGPSFLQMPNNFMPKYLDRLADYIRDIPEDFPMFLELRHTDWFTDPVVYDETFHLLEENGRGAVITDVAMRRDVLHQRLTNTKAFVRFNGYNFHPTDFTRLDQWVERIKIWIDAGLEELYFYPHQEEDVHVPKTCDYIINKLNQTCGLDIQNTDLKIDMNSL